MYEEKICEIFRVNGESHEGLSKARKNKENFGCTKSLENRKSGPILSPLFAFTIPRGGYRATLWPQGRRAKLHRAQFVDFRNQKEKLKSMIRANFKKITPAPYEVFTCD